jgi:hypothetical protein
VAKPIKTVRTARGVRYMRGGKFISKAAVKRSRAAKRRAKANPTPKKRVVRKAAPKKRAAPKRKAATPRKDPKRVAAGKKAARTRKRRAAAPKKTVRKRKTTAKRRKTVAKRKDPKRVRAAKKAARTRAAKKAARSRAAKKAARSRKKAPRRKKTTRRKKAVRRKGVVRNLRLRKPGSRKKRTYQVRRRKRRYTIGAKKNPMKAMKTALSRGAAFWAGLTGMRVINAALKIHVTDRFAASLPAQIAPLLPSLAGFIASTVIVPRVTKKKTFVESLQMGATVAMIDAVFNTFVKPALPASMVPYFSGYGEMTVYEPVAEYVDYDNRLGEGMSEYVPDNRYGQFQVTEALAMDEIDYMQRGGAGGVFAKTTLGRG